MTAKLDYAQIVANFGSVEVLRERVAAFQKAREDHAKTVDVPAPTEHGFIEWLVQPPRNGEFEVVNDPTNTTPDHPPKPLLTDRKKDMFALAAQLRWSLTQNGGVEYNGVIIPTNDATLARLVAARSAGTQRINYKVSATRFVEFTSNDIGEIVARQSAFIQRCYDTERELVEAIDKAKSHKQLDAIDVRETIITRPFEQEAK